MKYPKSNDIVNNPLKILPVHGLGWWHFGNLPDGNRNTGHPMVQTGAMKQIYGKWNNRSYGEPLKAETGCVGGAL